MLDAKLKNKVALITGSNNPYGIGASAAKALCRQGVKVFLHFFRPNTLKYSSEVKNSAFVEKFGEKFYLKQQTKTCDEVLLSIKEMGGQAAAYEADLSFPGTISKLFIQAERHFGKVDILINNAAYREADTFIPSNKNLQNKLVELWTDRPKTISDKSIDKIFSVNTRAVALMIKEYVHRYLKNKSRWGRIINISTVGAYCFPSEISYGASKFALEAYTRSAAQELGQFGITVNTISLGPIQTGWITDELEQELQSDIPLGRIGNPDDVSDVIVFLSSEQARWVTGQRLCVYGGYGI
jgi:3-oxoacyl-[acyl-carrier protein] reductase